MPRPLRIAFLGSACAASAAALSAFVEEPAAVGAMPASASPGPIGRIAPHAMGIVGIMLAGAAGEPPGAIEQIAARYAIPIVWVASVREATAAVRAAAPEVAVAACFPWRLPRAARQAPPLGILNIHPSLLPVGRGPQPIFWTLRRAEPVTGVTIHRMDAGLDTGPIVAQAEMAVAPGIRAPDLERALMARGAELLRDALPALAAGVLQPWPQPDAGATAAPLPVAADWTMVSSLPATWAWRFARGVAPLGGPLTAIAGGAAIPVRDAVAWSLDERLPRPVIERDDGTVRVRFSPGWVEFLRRG